MRKRGLIEDLNDFLIALAIVIVAIVLMHFVIQEKFSKVKGDVELYSDVVDSAQYLAFLNTPVKIDENILKVSDWLVLLCYDEDKRTDYGFEVMKQTKEFFNVEVFCSKESDPSISLLKNYFTLPSLGGDIKVVVININELAPQLSKYYDEIVRLDRKDLGYVLKVFIDPN